MPIAPVDSSGNVLYYEDTGRPGQSTDYVTIVMIHGAMFHSAIFRPMIPYAAQHNVRLVLLNLRDYPGSSPYTPAELDALRGPEPAAQAEALLARGLELVSFVHWFIIQENIPSISETQERFGALIGGIVLVPWSAGNSHVLSMLAHADKVPEETKALFDSHLRSIVLYDPSLTTVGTLPPDGLYSPLRERNLTTDEMVAIFPTWVSSYFPQVDDLASDEATMLTLVLSRVPLELRGDAAAARDPHRTSTVECMGAEMLASVIDPDAMKRSQILISRIDRRVYGENLRRALFHPYFPQGSGEHIFFWPALRVHVVWCDMTVGDCVLGAQWINVQARSRLYNGKGRSIRVHKLDGANHFIQWEEPERFVRFLANIM
ncbi:hypothetical protein BKA93DRAFT_729634 [Sparassis latifolia]